MRNVWLKKAKKKPFTLELIGKLSPIDVELRDSGHIYFGHTLFCFPSNLACYTGKPVCVKQAISVRLVCHHPNGPQLWEFDGSVIFESTFRDVAFGPLITQLGFDCNSCAIKNQFFSVPEAV